MLAGGATRARPPVPRAQRAAGRSWRIGAASSGRCTRRAASVLAAAVAGALRPAPGDTVLDLYCGAGLFAGVLAEAVGPDGTVIGIEADTGAVRDARHNLKPTPWARVHKGDAAAMLGRYGVSGAESGRARPAPGRPGPGGDRDPGRGRPRGRALQRIAYVSCDPATLARDIGRFGEHGWNLMSCARSTRSR